MAKNTVFNGHYYDNHVSTRQYLYQSRSYYWPCIIPTDNSFNLPFSVCI